MTLAGAWQIDFVFKGTLIPCRQELAVAWTQRGKGKRWSNSGHVQRVDLTWLVIGYGRWEVERGQRWFQMIQSRQWMNGRLFHWVRGCCKRVGIEVRGIKDTVWDVWLLKMTTKHQVEIENRHWGPKVHFKEVLAGDRNLWVNSIHLVFKPRRHCLIYSNYLEKGQSLLHHCCSLSAGY